MREILRNCYDSHTHFWATGQVAEGLKLHDLKSAADVAALAVQTSHFRSSWLVGFGWNHHSWPGAELPNKEILDQIFPHTPVFFSRVDGHASWLNSKAISELQNNGFDFTRDVPGGQIVRDRAGSPTGVLFDQAHIKALLLLPEFNVDQHRSFFKRSQQIFNTAGFTHIRDMSMHCGAWNLLREMENSEQLNVCIEAFVTVENLAQLEQVFDEIEEIKRDPSSQMRLMGVKIFIDGSLGSKTAFLSEKYLSEDSRGLLIWSPADIRELLLRSWQRGLQTAVHCIGDEAVHTAVSVARQVSASGVVGRLHLEHVQLLRPETLQMMKPLHITCHMQPCHWLSDYSWLPTTLNSQMLTYLFQWEQLRKNKIPFFFGSDSPIERPSLADNYQALRKSAEFGIPSLNADWKIFHQHPDSKWCPSETLIENLQVKETKFKGRIVFST